MGRRVLIDQAELLEPSEALGELERAITNLVDNAVKYGGGARLAMEKTPRGVRIVVGDTGPGIPPDIRPHIFDPYFSGREAGRGLGLGLSKAWRIVQLHGGSIDVVSPPGGGATFTILLPKQAIHS